MLPDEDPESELESESDKHCDPETLIGRAYCRVRAQLPSTWKVICLLACFHKIHEDNLISTSCICYSWRKGRNFINFSQTMKFLSNNY